MFIHGNQEPTFTIFASSATTTYHHHAILFNGNQLVCNDSNINACVKECARQYPPIDQQACVTAVEAKFAPYSHCFDAETTVIVRGSHSLVPMRSVNVGDSILDVDLGFSKVVAWLHRDQETTATFLDILHENGRITCTPEHLIYCCEAADYVSADKARCLQVLYVDGSVAMSRIIKRSSRVLKGIYAPLTSSGTLLANGVHASCYASPSSLPFMVTQNMGQLALLPFRLMKNMNGFAEMYCRSIYSLLAS